MRFMPRGRRTIQPGIAQLLVALPYKVRNMGLRLAASKLQPGQRLRFDAAVNAAKPSFHVFHTELVDPNGAIVPYYTQNLEAGYGRRQSEVCLAQNEAPGAWKLRVTDVGTGARAEQTFTIAKPLSKATTRQALTTMNAKADDTHEGTRDYMNHSSMVFRSVCRAGPFL